VCPWNIKFARDATAEAFVPRPTLTLPDVASFSTMNAAEFKVQFGDTPLARGTLSGLKRNATTVLGNASTVPTHSLNS